MASQERGVFQRGIFEPTVFQVEIRGGKTPRFEGSPPGRQEEMGLARLRIGDTPGEGGLGSGDSTR